MSRAIYGDTNCDFPEAADFHCSVKFANGWYRVTTGGVVYTIAAGRWSTAMADFGNPKPRSTRWKSAVIRLCSQEAEASRPV